MPFVLVLYYNSCQINNFRKVNQQITAHNSNAEFHFNAKRSTDMNELVCVQISGRPDVESTALDKRRYQHVYDGLHVIYLGINRMVFFG